MNFEEGFTVSLDLNGLDRLSDINELKISFVDNFLGEGDCNQTETLTVEVKAEEIDDTVVDFYAIFDHLRFLIYSIDCKLAGNSAEFMGRIEEVAKKGIEQAIRLSYAVDCLEDTDPFSEMTVADAVFRDKTKQDMPIKDHTRSALAIRTIRPDLADTIVLQILVSTSKDDVQLGEIRQPVIFRDEEYGVFRGIDTDDPGYVGRVVGRLSADKKIIHLTDYLQKEVTTTVMRQGHAMLGYAAVRFTKEKE